MKKLLFLFSLFLTTNVFATPDSSMSISPAAVDAAVITASDENTRNNAISSTYNAHDHNDIDQTANTLNVGDAVAGNKTITAYNADANKPFIRYNDTNNNWVISSDGVASSNVLSGGGTIFEGSTDNSFQTLFNIIDPTADRTITFPNADINFVDGLPVANGGTGVITITGLIKGNGTSDFTAAVAGTDYQAALTSPMVYGDTRRKIVYTTYDLTTATGTQAITGAGFAPKGVSIVANVDGGSRLSVTFNDSTIASGGFVDQNGDTAGSYAYTTEAAVLRTDSANRQNATIQSYDSDGITLSWTKTGSPTGTANLGFYFER